MNREGKRGQRIKLNNLECTALMALLTSYRQAKDMTQEDLAEESGVGVKTICSFERCAERARTITFPQLLALLRGCGVEFTVFAEEFANYYWPTEVLARSVQKAVRSEAQR